MIASSAETVVYGEQVVGPAAPASPSRKATHLPELDGIRGIAILLVLAFHGFAWSMQYETWAGLPRVIALVTLPGEKGVDLFFVLSGFLITGILLDSVGRPRYFRNFYARRALRILPLYYLMLFLIGISYSGSRGFVVLGIFYLSNMAPLFRVAVVYGPLWSLSVEEHFYLLWPWLISRLKPDRVWLLASGIFLAEPVFRGFAFFHGWDVATYSWFRLDGLAAGALLASFVRSDWYSEKRLLRLGSSCIVGAAILAGIGLPFGLYTRKTLTGAALLFTFFSLLFAGVISVVLSGGFRCLSGLMRSRSLGWCGDLSYCLYIVHWLIFYGWDSIIGKHPARVVAGLGRFGALCIRALAVYLICFTLAEVSRRYFEGPLLRLKRFFAYA
jgi:peptidoglycan/LPS O-acetylase OafA/YrhL